MMTCSRRKRKRAVIGLIVIAAILHLPAYAVVGRFADLELPLDKSSLIVMSATIFLAWALSFRRGLPTRSSVSRPIRQTVHRTPRKTAFRGGSRQQALRWKEFLLLRRDPWLVSQSLMQLLYLVPPALLLVRSFSDRSAATMLVTPVIVMAAGQLAGGLAWLTISGEDRPTWWPPRRCHPARVNPRQGRSGADSHRRDLRAAGRCPFIRFALRRRLSPRLASPMATVSAAAI